MFHPFKAIVVIVILFRLKQSVNNDFLVQSLRLWNDPKQPQQQETQETRRAVALFLDGPSYMYGFYSIRNQMIKFGMTKENNIDLIAVIPTTFTKQNPREVEILTNWTSNGEDSVYEVDKEFLLGKINEGLWKEVFNKLWLFNVTDYDKLIVLDTDVLIRTNLKHWFDYPTPCATQANDNIEWNSGAMVISPDSQIFSRMVELLPNVTLFQPKRHTGEEKSIAADGWNSGYHDQGFLSSFFTHPDHGDYSSPLRMKTMPTEASVLSSSIGRQQFLYFVEQRRHIIETVHFTLHKPWRENAASSNPVVCAMLQEWKASVRGITEETGLPPLPNFLRNCNF